ncbi:MAG TPA: transglycosylase domain-containing protein, partial [Aggregatilineales bacterium]|nr:transglycosylase domain-containing protein [Aggregatilineales bacterium]
MSYQTQQPGTPNYDQGQPDPALSSVYQTQYGAPPPQQPQRRRRSRITCRTACLGCGLIFVAGTLLFLCVGLTAGLIIWNNLYQQVSTKWDTALKQEQQQTFQTASVYDRAGNQLHELFGEGRRTEIKLAEMPQSLLDATTSVEDSSFYTNNGVDMQANLRAGWQYLTTGQIVSGGSTITQQLVRGIAFDYQYRTQQSFQRKFEEIIMALIVTREKSKNDILEMYLNQIYYGHLAYGIEAAAQTYFGKSAKDLTLAEASLLAGLPQQPADLDPLNPDPAVQQAVLDRRTTVLNLMVANGKITRAQADSTLAEVLHFADPNVNLKSPHFTLYAENELKTLLDGLGMPPSTLNTAGLQVYTTLDPAYESLAESVAGQQIASIKA